MALVEVEGVTHWIILVLGHALGGAVAVEPPNEGLPPGAGQDLGPVAKLLERPQATRPPSVTGGRRIGVGPGGGADALPPRGTASWPQTARWQ